MNKTMATGKLIIISAPSGCGKSTIINDIINDKSLKLEFSISATNREPRRGEQHGVNYYFISDEEFRKAIAEDALVEYEEVYPGRFYGTLKSEIERIRNAGRNVILDIDVKGAMNVMKHYADDSLSIFIKPPTLETLRHRLLSRGTETVEAIDERVSRAEFEISFADKFNKVVVNDVLRTAIDEVHTLIADFVKE